MSIYSLSCPTIGCYQNFNCDPEFLNKIVAVAFVKKSASGSIDKTTSSEWMLSFFQASLDGNAFLVFNTSGDKPKPETATVAGRGMQTTKALAKTHTVNVMDMQGVVQSNVSWYNDMLSNSAKYDFYYFTPDRIWDASGYYVTVIGDPVITAELNTYQMAEVSIQWVSKTNPLPYVFNTSDFLEGLYFSIVDATALGSPTTLFTLTNSTPVDPDWSVVLNQAGMLTLGDFIWSLQDGADAVPQGLIINDQTGFITAGAGTDNGTYNVVAVVTNAAGCVFGSLEITVVVEL